MQRCPYGKATLFMVFADAPRKVLQNAAVRAM
jgi:hypothetical protein